jgi:hypothetical protein
VSAPYPPHGYGPGAPPPPPAKKNTGCWIALAIFAGIALLVFVSLGIAAWQIYNTPGVREVAEAVGEGAKILVDAQTAPGTKELRDQGCDQAMVFDVDRIMRFAKKRLDAGTGARPPDVPALLVICQVAHGGAPPNCDDVAAHYLRTAPPPAGEFGVVVGVEARGRRVDGGTGCAIRYDPSGKLIGPFNPDAVPIPEEQP